MGPSALRYARLHEALEALGYHVVDHGDIDVPVVESLRRSGQEPGGMAYLPAIHKACLELREALQGESSFPIVLGGDHSIAMGSVPGAAQGVPTGVIWVDAHGDFNTPETSPSGNIHGMPLAALCGFGDPRLLERGPWVDPRHVVLIGVRSLDPGEVELLRQAGPTLYTMKEVDRMGMSRIAEEALERLSALPRIHLSLDADVLDPEIAPGVGTPVPGGLTYREAHLLMELFSDSGRISSLDLVEVNPILDRENRTARIMVELAASLLGKRIF